MRRISTPSNRRRARTGLAWAAGLIAVAVVAFLAGRWTLVPPTVETEARATETYTVANADIGNAIDISATVTWDITPVGTNSADGTVTGVMLEGPRAVSEGDALFAVDLRPVTVAQGTVPSFRALSSGAAGADVLQLEGFLSRLGYFADQPDDQFKFATTQAVKAWQKDLKVAQSGAVEPGDLVYLEELPATVLLDESVQTGASISAGTNLVSSVGNAPEFTATVSMGARSEGPVIGTEVDVSGPDALWRAIVSDQRRDDSGNAVFDLTGLDGGPVCGGACDGLPFSKDPTALAASAILEPEVSGPAVPLSALGTAPDGSTFVITPGGERRPVTVVASDGSRAILNGVKEGEVVRLYAIETDSPASGAAAPSETTVPSATTSPSTSTVPSEVPAPPDTDNTVEP